MARNKIKFEMDTPNEQIINDLVDIQKQFYTVKPTKICGSIRFHIPIVIKNNLNLKPGDVYTISQIETDSEYHIEFSINNKRNKNSYVRHLAYAGTKEMLYACIPTQILKLIPGIISIALIHPTAYKEHEWIIKFLTTDSI